jgi:hypothetical protein
MSHKKAIAPDGTRFSATATVARCELSVSHAPFAAVSDGAERRRRTRARPNNSENTMPAAAAARDVRRPAPVTDSW